ncbi:hypothetical protein SELMODRAFT_426706 [Selaginella moellendorffii]|uniref:Uncharacterized protein n=1 Tax=Selaginella moellendorffii TaxID=88036 RepID=D8SX85_SELML|nr:hypothetical protein SELMODRAFT_426706 [Selaginella moellendorffii]
MCHSRTFRRLRISTLINGPAKWEEKEEQCPAYTLTIKIRTRRAENAYRKSNISLETGMRTKLELINGQTEIKHPFSQHDIRLHRCTEKSVLCCIVSSGESSVPWPNGVAQAWKQRWWRFKLSVPFSDDLRTRLFELDVYGKSTMGHQVAGLTGKSQDMTTRSFYRRPFCNTNQESNHVRFKLLVCMSYLSKMLLDRDSDRDEEKVATPRQSRYQPYIYDFNSIITGCVQSPDSDQEQPDQEVFSVLSECARESSGHHRLTLWAMTSTLLGHAAGP